MRLQALILIQIFLLSQSFITYDSNQVSQQSGNYFSCYDGKSYTNTTTFSGQFENVPQVFLTLEYIDESTPYTIINFSIITITTTNFQTTIKCTNHQLYKFFYKWYAIDDNRIQVINLFDHTKFGQDSVPHPNANVIKGFPSIFTYSYTSAFSLDISIDEITTTTVKYTITSTGGLVNVGFSIVLILEESYNFIERASKTADYTSTAINLIPNFWFIAAYVGFNYPNTDWIREYKSYVITSTQITYKFLHNGTKCPITFLAAWLAYIFSRQFMPMEIKRVNSALYNDQSEDQPFNTIRVLELNKYYTSFGTNYLIVDQTTNILNIEVIQTCNTGKKFIANFNSCYSCLKNPQRLTNACLSMQNKLVYRIRLQSVSSDYKELYFILSNTGVQIKQITYNQKITETVHADIQMQNQ